MNMRELANIFRDAAVEQMAKMNGVSEATVVAALKAGTPNACRQLEELVTAGLEGLAK